MLFPGETGSIDLSHPGARLTLSSVYGLSSVHKRNNISPPGSLSRRSLHLKCVPLQKPSSSQTDNSAAPLARRERAQELGTDWCAGTGIPCLGHPSSEQRAAPPHNPLPLTATPGSRGSSPGPKSKAARVLNAGSSSPRGP